MRAAFLACLPRVSHEGIEERLSLRGFSLPVSRFKASTLIFFFLSQNNFGPPGVYARYKVYLCPPSSSKDRHVNKFRHCDDCNKKQHYEVECKRITLAVAGAGG